ncbi:SusC/RagA family TonB-linked outer membrane protein [Sinomicrobium soli]|uniref:SusC/RagA family TonB-linked outer membrane protein n=1 Tax=Sinomicrobium sp. N-1-3-6 TaxID=2219864 RepID=UPI001374B361|nr:SusC/RagA family TonB-linked outer membrane protein [Sinomicrobium sp. N-1-3-6]
MRGLIGLFCIVSMGMTPKSGLSQSTIIIENDTTMTVHQVFDLIMVQSDYFFLFEDDIIKGLPQVTLKKGKTNAKLLLDKSLSPGQIRYEIKENNQILLFKDPSNPDIKTSGDLKPQQFQVNGTITGSKGEVLVGVTVMIKNSQRGTLSDIDGYYQLKVNPQDVLVFSYVGFRKIEITFSGQDILDVQMEEEITSLDEVVVNAGYYKISERNRTGSISRVTSKEIQDQPVTNPLMALQGRVTGLEISPSSGTPGIAAKIRVRGENSLRVPGKLMAGLSEGGRPMYIIDGVPVSSESISSVGGTAFIGGIDPLATINPENIESIEVLKDADATSIYGSRGANGVILITTKRGQLGGREGTDFQLSMYKGLGKYTTRANLLNTEQYLAMRREALANDEIDLNIPIEDLRRRDPDLYFWDQDRYTDWQKVLLGGTADITDIQGNISGGNGYTYYRFGGAYHKESLITPGKSNYNRASGNININHRSKDNRFTANVSATYGIGMHDISGGSSVSNALELPPNAPDLFDENGELNWAIDPLTGVSSWVNPLAGTKVTTETDSRNLVGNLGLSYEIFSQFRIKLNAGYTELKVDEIRKSPLTSIAPERRFNIETGRGEKASANFHTNMRRSTLIEPQLEWSYDIADHHFDVLIGATYQKENNQRTLIEGEEYDQDAFLGSLQGATIINIPIDREEIYKYAALFGRVGYTFKNKYLLNLTGRRDGSSRFGPGKRFGNFGAIGAAYIFSDETFIREKLSFISFGKLRGSYGTTGNDQIGNYKYLDLYTLSIPFMGNMTLIPNGLYNPDFRWEKTDKLELALELSFLKDRVSIQTNWYQNRSKNQLIARVLPYSTGFTSITDNFSEALIQNSGWEFLLRGTLIQNPDFTWSMSFNLSVNRNKLVSFEGIEDSPYSTIFKVGESLSIQRLYVWEGVDPETGEHQFLDKDDNGIINDEDKVFNNALDRDFYGGITQELSYKGLGLSFLFQFSRQNARFIESRTPGYNFNQPDYVLDRWQEPGDMTNVQRYSTQGTMGTSFSQFRSSTGNLEDASFIRLKSLNLSYTFSKGLINKFNLKNLRLFVQGQNLLTFTGYSGPDPETRYGLPPLRMITTGFHITF